MTAQQKENLLDQVKSWLLPLFMGIAAFFTSEIYREVKELKNAQMQIEVHKERTSTELRWLSEEVKEIKGDVKELKKTLDAGY